MSMVRINRKTFIHQPDATLSQANPVSANLYTVLDTTNAVRIISMIASVTWTVQPSPLEFVLTIDGNTLTFAQANPVSVTSYSAAIVEDLNEASQLMVGVGSNTPYRAFEIEGRSVRVQARTTGGTVQNLSARVKYARLN